MEKVLFLTNEVFLDETKPEGGVRLCTNDYIKLLQTKYEVITFKLKFNKSIFFRLKAKLGIDVFEDYNPNDYSKELFASIDKNAITKVFINLSNASAISLVIKNQYHNKVKIILCSHGFEAGDFLHQTVRFKQFSSFFKKITGSWRLGKILQNELNYRIKAFDLILTVSEIEESIEYWLGAKQVFFVPRIFEPDFINWQPKLGNIGFIADVSHYPNYYGLLLLCEAIQNAGYSDKIDVRVVGKNCVNLELLCEKFSFITKLGYLTNEELKKEASTWMYYLNLVFYYSKGVSTKLAKGMNWGLPVLSTTAGNRGYIFKEGGVVTCSSPKEMLGMIINRIDNTELLEKDKCEVEKAVYALSDYNIIMEDLYPLLSKL